MNPFLFALSKVMANEFLEESTPIPCLVVKDYNAAEILSTYINMEGGTGHIYGSFTTPDRGKHWKVSYDLFEERSHEVSESAE